MPRYEYRVMPAPEQGKKVKGVKGTPNRFAVALEDVMNEMGAEGWEYQRTDTLPCQERVGLTGRQTTFQHMLVFRREAAAAEVSDSEVTALLAAPTPAKASASASESPAPAEAELVQEPGEAEEVAERTRDAMSAARDAAAALSAHAREGKAPSLGPARRDGEKSETGSDKDPAKAKVAAE